MTGPARGSNRVDPERDLLDNLVQTSFVVMGILTRFGARHDLSLTQVRLLGILRDRQPKMAELAEHLGLERSTVTGLVDRAAQRGLVERRASPGDLRAAHVALTEQGHQLASQAGDEIADDAAFLLDSLTPAQRRQLLALLQRLSEA